MNIISATKNGAIAFNWDKNYEESVIELFYMARDTEKKEIDKLCSVVWEHDKDLLVAILFYTRAFRSIKHIDVKGKGEKMLSYHIALWLLRHDIATFLKNYNYYISVIGCYRDCLVLAKTAIEQLFSVEDIYTLLAPMSSALIIDTQHVISNPTSTRITLAAKWAPRQNKSFHVCIKYLKKLCGISGSKSDAKWRKYIQTLMKYYDKPVTETSLSSMEYGEIDFANVPSKAFNLYKNLFATHPELSNRFAIFLANATSRAKINVSTLHPHEIIKPYLMTHSDNISHVTEAQWENYISDFKQTDLPIYIPMVDVSGSMHSTISGGVSMLQIAVSLGLTLSEINTGIFKNRVITFSSEPTMIELSGDTLLRRIKCLFASAYGSPFNTDFVKAFNALIEFIVENDIPQETVRKIKVIAITDMEFDASAVQSHSPLSSVYIKFRNAGYEPPQLVFWNLNSRVDVAPCMSTQNNVSIIGGYEPSIIAAFKEMGEINPHIIPFHVLNMYKKLVK